MDQRNICIIAHVDHGKTTLVDFLLKQAGTFRENESVDERIMDSMDLERERGITIQAKNASAIYNDTRINIVDTPGHADFGGEVERILGMVDGAILLVDGAEGPLPQTRFVLQKSLEKGQKVILCINKVDRPECQGTGRVQEVVDQAFDLFLELGATEEQADFPIIYACARNGWCTDNFDDVEHLLNNQDEGSLKPLFELILNHLSPPKIKEQDFFQMQITNIDWSDYVGRLAIGRVESGTCKVGDTLTRQGEDKSENFKVTKIFSYEGLKKVDVQEANAGDIIILSGCENFEIGDTLTSDSEQPPIERIHVDPPSIAMIFSVNTSPFSGKEGEAIQSRKLRERLLKETRHNVALRFEETDSPDQFRVLGRGELQFAILIEQMRREGLEFMVGKPIVLTKMENDQKLEPMDSLTLDLPEDYSGDVTRIFQERKGILNHYENISGGRIRLQFEIPTRGILGMRSKYLTATRGEGLMSSEGAGYAPWKGDMLHRTNGALVADRKGPVTEYALQNLEDRGELFIQPGIEVYEGMIIGEFNKDNDLNVNPCREKKLTNMRASGSDNTEALKGTRNMSLEKCLEWIDEDEWIEITPESIRLRKKVLAGNQRTVKRK